MQARITGIELAEPASAGVVSDAGVVTSGSPDDSAELAAEFIAAIEQHRHWDRGTKRQVPA